MVSSVRYWGGRAWPHISRLLWAVVFATIGRVIVVEHGAPIWVGDCVAIWIGLTHIRFTATRYIVGVYR
jgi:hypothetical protein